jgi:hypothetical protein
MCTNKATFMPRDAPRPLSPLLIYLSGSRTKRATMSTERRHSEGRGRGPECAGDDHELAAVGPVGDSAAAWHLFVSVHWANADDPRWFDEARELVMLPRGSQPAEQGAPAGAQHPGGNLGVETVLVHQVMSGDHLNASCRYTTMASAVGLGRHQRAVPALQRSRNQECR